MPEDISLAARLARLDGQVRSRILSSLSDEDCALLNGLWRFWARPKQLPPPGDWLCWLVMAGRGFGKTRLGAEWIHGLAAGPGPFGPAGRVSGRIALVGKSEHDVRAVMVEGESGILNTGPPENRPKYEPSLRRLTWPSGTVAQLYSADDPDQLRGPEHGAAWADELGKWSRAEACWSNLMLGLRVGPRPRVLVTTTPRPIQVLKNLVSDPKTHVTRGSTWENAANLSPAFRAEAERLYAGTRLGRQELDGHLLDDADGALWSWRDIEKGRRMSAPSLERIVVAVDPPVSTGENADACGIIIAARSGDGHAYILADRSSQGESPAAWMHRVIRAYEGFSADRIVAEVNQGGDLVESLLRQIAPEASYRPVRASRGKYIRAEPVAALYERGLVHHLPGLAALEDEMLNFTDGKGGQSPNRVDALVWAVTDLMLHPRRKPRLRPLV